MNAPTPASPAPPTPARLWKATLVALATATAILFIAVLPAEYGLDPLGTGHALGLLPAAHAPSAPVAPAPDGRLTPTVLGSVTYYGSPFATDQVTLVIGPYDYVEYKYRLERGATMQFSWRATSTVGHNFHSDPDDTDAEPSIDSQQRGSGFGSFTAPSTGMHGWFWENPGDAPITITLTTAGFYASAMEYRPNKRQIRHEIRIETAP